METRSFCVTFIITATFMASSARSQNNLPELLPVKICEESTTFQDSCNICQCSRDGSRKFCTQYKCSTWGVLWAKIKSPFRHDDSVCEAGRDYQVGCHICTCDDDASSIVCPEEPCPSSRGTILKNYLRPRN